MINTLQPSSLIPYRDDITVPEHAGKPAIIIPINTETKISLSNTKELMSTSPMPFEKWKMPVQEEGYIKGRGFDFL